MKKITVQEYHCKFCGREMEGGRGYLANPFCDLCLDERLEASGAIDLRDNHIIEDVGNGYIRIVPIDPNKKWKATKKEGEGHENSTSNP